MLAQQRLKKHLTVTETNQITISDALRRRAQSVINDGRTDPQWRNIIRYALEINDPWLADIVRRAGAGEKIIDSVDFSLEPQDHVATIFRVDDMSLR